MLLNRRLGGTGPKTVQWFTVYTPRVFKIGLMTRDITISV